MNQATYSLPNTTSNTTTPWPTTTRASTTEGFLSTNDGKAILALLVTILTLLILVPVIVFLLMRKICTMQEEKTDKRSDQPDNDNNKETQTDVLGLELQEFYQRRRPTDMSKYMGKKLIEVEEPPRWHQFNPKEWNDPWTSKYAGKETNYIGKVW
ncbi:uncharacterized protein LOC123541069 [Mercenaria mercenaria]|uniref:uncharacterized protein LOC123541069 n=1 Tax=Mercenaria mercenaria TaxID=6596 RepID=UPI00234EE5CA|nr:uncharacterized protein LOC123541069 [Mercenaria mercenaria]